MVPSPWLQAASTAAAATAPARLHRQQRQKLHRRWIQRSSCYPKVCTVAIQLVFSTHFPSQVLFDCRIVASHGQQFGFLFLVLHEPWKRALASQFKFPIYVQSDHVWSHYTIKCSCNPVIPWFSCSSFRIARRTRQRSSVDENAGSCNIKSTHHTLEAHKC